MSETSAIGILYRDTESKYVTLLVPPYTLITTQKIKTENAFKKLYFKDASRLFVFVTKNECVSKIK
jgi:hypothetical protein